MSLFVRARETRAGAGRDGMFAVTLAPTPASALAARQAVEQLLGPAGGPGSFVALVASELVTNAVLHARTAVGFSIAVAEDRHSAVVEVHDELPPGRQQLRPRRQDGLGWSIRGRGLALVSQLSTKWGVRPEGEGKTVWALVPLNDEPGLDQRI
jgi:anti-sigma regulatory factor (Ser/Thr protein kinase)